jgi:hypothetical protein
MFRGAPAKIDPVVVASAAALFCRPVAPLTVLERFCADATSILSKTLRSSR